MIDDYFKTFENFKKNVIEQNKIENENSSDSPLSKQQNKSNFTKRMNIFALAKASKSEGKIRKRLQSRIDFYNQQNDLLFQKFDQIRMKKIVELTEFQKTKNIVKLKDRELLLKEYPSLTQTDSSSKNSFVNRFKYNRNILKVKKQRKLKMLMDNTYNYYNSNFGNNSNQIKNKKDNSTQINNYNILELNIIKIAKGKKTLLNLKNCKRKTKHFPTSLIFNNINSNYSRNTTDYSCSSSKTNIRLDLSIRNKKHATTKTKIAQKYKNLYNNYLTYNSALPKLILKKQGKI